MLGGIFKLSMRNKKFFICNIALILVIAVLISSMGILLYILPRQSFSEEENRALAQLPHMSASSLFSGEWFSRLSLFYSDNIPFRKSLIKTKAICELALGKRQNNDVLFLKGGRLVDRCEYDSRQLSVLSENSKSARALLEERAHSCIALVPRSADIYADGESAREARRAAYGGEETSELFRRLCESTRSGTSVYYLTDHHLNANGAYILYAFVLEELGISALPQGFFHRQQFSTSFFGSTYSKCGLIKAQPDTVTLYRYEKDLNYTVSCTDSDCTLRSLYSFEAASIKDKYRVFTDGNHPILTIKSIEGASRPSLLIIKDSFANACLPLLAAHFDLTVYDPRYTSVPLPECDYTALIMGIDTLASMNITLQNAQ